jgi:predicted HAD superfamily Cof-like phosphohydrolase
MIDYEGMVREFSEKFSHYIGDLDRYPPRRVVLLRRRLITEEAREWDEAAQILDLDKIAKELADLLYVVFGAAIAFGLPIDEVFKEVHRSNMTKEFVKDGGGKTLKGKDYVEPNLLRILYGKEKRGRPVTVDSGQQSNATQSNTAQENTECQDSASHQTTSSEPSS